MEKMFGLLSGAVIECPTLGLGHDLEPCVGLRAQHAVSLSWSLPLPLFPHQPCARALSLSNK